MFTYYFPKFTLEYNAQTEGVTTKFVRGLWSGGVANPDDAFHANLLGITPSQHRLLHELGHHLVAISKGNDFCPIVFASAKETEMPKDAKIMEWEITAVCYMAMEKPMRDPEEWGAIMNLAKVCNVYTLKNNLSKLWGVHFLDGYLEITDSMRL